MPSDLSIKVGLHGYPYPFLVLPVKDDCRIDSKNPLHSQTLLRRFGCPHGVRFWGEHPDYASIPEYITKVVFMSRA